MNRLALALAAFTFLSAPALADDIKAETKLSSATVYGDRAMLSRHAEIHVPAGAHMIIIEGLSPQIMGDSLRTKGESIESMSLGAISHKIVNQAELSGEREAALQKELEERQISRQKIEAEKAALLQQKNFLESLKAEAITKTKEELTQFVFNTDQWIAASKTIQSGLAEASAGIIDKDAALAQVDKEIEAIQNNLNQLYTGDKSTLQVSIPVEAKTAGTLEIDLSYQIPGARWMPVYDARLDTKTGGLEIIQYGAVTQNTGEDWDNITLTLSTARPNVGAGLPKPQPSWVDIFVPQPTSPSYMIARGMSNEMAVAAAAPIESSLSQADFSDHEPPMRKQKQQIALVAATIETGGMNAEYKIAGANDVKSDGTETKLLIGNFKTENQIEIQVQPQISTSAYLVAKAKIEGENPILPGPVSLFRDGDFIGNSKFPLIRAGKETELAFGIDDQIAVKRDTLSDESGQSGMLIGVENVAERAYSTEVENLRKTDVSLVVLETVPAPRHEDIRLEITADKTTKGYEMDADKVKGLIRWKMPLKSSEKTSIDLGWKLFWPKDQNISGLPTQ